LLTLSYQAKRDGDESKGGNDDYSNFRALCSVCNEGAPNIKPMRPDLKQLMINIRRATADDQLNALEWLVQKFPAQAAKLTAK